MARDYSDNNWSRKFRYEPLIKVMLRSILHWKKFPEISKLFLAKKKGTTTVVNGGRQIWMDLDHVITKSLIEIKKKIERALMLAFSLARRICLLKNQVNF